MTSYSRLPKFAACFLLCLSLSFTQLLASTLHERASKTFTTITESLRESQLPSGAWEGVIEADPSVDLMPLVLAKNIGLWHPSLEEETYERLYKRQDPKTGLWSGYPDGPACLDTTGTILLTLKYLGIPENEPRLIQAWKWFKPRALKMKLALSPGNRLIGVMGKWLIPKVFPEMPPKIMALPHGSPINIHRVGFGRMAVIPYSIWAFYHRAINKNLKVLGLDPERIESKGSLFAKPSSSSSNEFWVQEGLGWLLDHQQADGTWGGALQMTYFSMLALYEAQLAGVGNFEVQLKKAWDGLMSWRAKIPEGSVIQQSTIGPVMDTGRILSAISAAPHELSMLALPEQNRSHAVAWLLSQQITKKGDWSNLQPKLAPGGWTFQYFNDFNPDCDDTAMALEGLAKSDLSRFPEAESIIYRGVTWLSGMQNKDGGFPAWDRGVTPLLRIGLKLINAPEMSDESQVDISSRTIKALVAVKHTYPKSIISTTAEAPIKNACRFLEKSRRKTSNSPLKLWRGEWMTNYLYGTSEAVGALMESECWSLEETRPYIEWLLSKQQKDGGWGESPESYKKMTYVQAPSTLSQTEWVLTALMTYEKLRLQQDTELPSIMNQIEKGINFLITRMGDQKSPYETEFTGTFVRGVWYARYVSLAHYEGVRVLGAYLSLSTVQH